MSKDLLRICHFTRDLATITRTNSLPNRILQRNSLQSIEIAQLAANRSHACRHILQHPRSTHMAVFHTCSVCISLTQMSLNNRHSRKFAWPIDRYTAIRISRPIKSILLHSINPFLKLIEWYWEGHRLIIRLSTSAAADKTAANPRRWKRDDVLSFRRDVAGNGSIEL